MGAQRVGCYCGGVEALLQAHHKRSVTSGHWMCCIRNRVVVGATVGDEVVGSADKVGSGTMVGTGLEVGSGTGISVGKSVGLVLTEGVALGLSSATCAIAGMNGAMPPPPRVAAPTAGSVRLSVVAAAPRAQKPATTNAFMVSTQRSVL